VRLFWPQARSLVFAGKGGLFASLPRWCFLFPPWCIPWGWLLFSQPFRLWSLCSPSPPGSGVLCLFVFGFFVLLVFSGRRFFPRRPAGCFVFVLSRRWRALVPNLSILWMLDLRLSIGFLETRATQMGSPASSCSAAVCSGRRDHWWPVRDRHAPVKCSFRRACGGLVPAFFRRAKAVAGHWGTDLMVGGFGGGAYCTRAGLRRRQCYPPTCWVEFFC
jgi:hypothetical protein